MLLRRQSAWLVAIIMAVVMALVLSACQTIDPITRAETVGQKAFATYHTFVVIEEVALELVKDEAVHPTVKRYLIELDQGIKPIMDSMLEMAEQYVELKALLDGGVDETERADLVQRISLAAGSLTTLVASASDGLGELKAAVLRARADSRSNEEEEMF